MVRDVLPPQVRGGVLVWWLVCAALGGASIMPYIGLVGWDAVNQLPDSLEGKVAMARWLSYFPEQGGRPSVGMVRLLCEPGASGCPSSVLHDPDAKALVKHLATDARQHGAELDSYWSSPASGPGAAAAMAERFVTPDQRATLFVVPGASDQVLDEAIIAAMAAQNPEPARLWAGVMSIDMLNRATLASVCDPPLHTRRRRYDADGRQGKTP